MLSSLLCITFSRIFEKEVSMDIDDNVKFLGMYFDCHLKWKQHSDNLIKKLNTAIFMLRKLQPNVSEQVLQMVIFLIFSLNLVMELFSGAHLHQ
jgi:hypothetical protein